MWTVQWGNREVVQLLLATDADLTLKNNNSQTALDIANRRANSELIALLQYYVEGNIENE